LFQRVSVLVQRFNSVLLRESFTADSRPDDDLYTLLNFFLPRELLPRVKK